MLLQRSDEIAENGKALDFVMIQQISLNRFRQFYMEIRRILTSWELAKTRHNQPHKERKKGSHNLKLDSESKTISIMIVS